MSSDDGRCPVDHPSTFNGEPVRCDLAKKPDGTGHDGMHLAERPGISLLWSTADLKDVPITTTGDSGDGYFYGLGIGDTDE